MTTYRRRGHWRQGRDGTRHWVSEHSVTTSSRRNASHSRTQVRPRQRREVPKGPYSARWARPNARCPFCGAAVFFYSNEHGSRVYFDELGPPWPKHPCTDRMMPVFTNNPRTNFKRTAPPLYRRREGRRLAKHAGGVEPRSQFLQQRGTLPGDAWLVREQHRYLYGAILHLNRPYDATAMEGRTISTLLPLVPCGLVFIKHGWLSYFDPDAFEVITVPVSDPFPVPSAPRRRRHFWSRRS